MSKVVFLDRDGVINKKAARHDYIKKWDEFKFLPRVSEAFRVLNEAGYLGIVVTNQRGVARGLMTIDDVEKIHANMCAELERQGARIDAVYVCPHEEGECNCRKPGIGLFLQAEKNFDIDKPMSWIVGDSETDIVAGKRYGIKTIYIGTEATDADFKCENLYEAALIIIGGRVI